jgi:ATP-dependent DNA helicase RecG
MDYSESFKVELKREINADFKKEIIAFANSDGGEIYIGVEDDGTIVGVEDKEDTMERIGNMIRDGIKPDLTAYTSIEALEDHQKTIIKVTILRGTKRPYHLIEKGLKPSGVFLRHGISSVPATDEIIRQMLRESDGVTFDKSRSVNQDLTFDYTQKYFKENNLTFNESNKRTLGLIDLDGYYTNVALLLSEQCEHSIKCAVYEGCGKTHFKARKAFYGSILKQMDEAYEFLTLNNNLNSTFDKLKRIDHPDYPPYALREALLNAIVHRDYDYSGSILINIFDDRIEFVSIGGLVKGITITDILGGVSQPRNMVLANIFYRLELIESYGTGIGRILESYQNYVHKPAFTAAPASFVVTLPKTTNIANLIATDTLAKEEKVLKLIEAKGEITRKDVENLLGCSKLPAINVLNKLLEQGKIIKSGAARTTKYQLST